MFPYFALLIVSALFSFHAVRIVNKPNRGRVLSISRSKESSAIWVFFCFLLLLLMLRAESVGRDLVAYKMMFLEKAAGGFGYVTQDWREILFRLYSWIIRQFTEEYQIYLMITATVTIIPMAHVYLQDKNHGYLKVSIFVTLPTFIMMFSGIRQSMAMAIGMLAYCSVRKRKFICFLLLVVVATLVHNSGFVLVFMYPLYYASIPIAIAID